MPNRLSGSFKTALVVAVGEFCGTFMFLLLSFMGAQTALNTSGGLLDASTLLYIASSFGTALAVNVWVFYRVTGGMFNPAVTLGLVLVGAVKPIRALYIFPSQLIAAIAAAAVTDGLLPGALGVTNGLGSGTSVVQGLFIEMFLTAQLVLTVYFLAVEKHRATFLAPVGIGVSVFIAHMAGTNFTGTGINPVRSLGPAIVTGHYHGYHWIYWLGPCLGALLSFGVYSLLKVLEYQIANPGQDAGDPEEANEEALAAAEMGTEGLAMFRSRSRSGSTAPGGVGLRKDLRRGSAADGGRPVSAAEAV
ncbi:aquaporin-like protein [Trichoderma citrinoviride]|uniref:Aquaporin-like protein n=1 Tax=Trichoderma citrinoviride TaxID=58853 RepID=A0A2T4B3E0_9HYPO|nr:aquaporin-like protein [Trichoderma citrinoviride]PTB63839.1 aquaporin-like protein [Trichoderma citrinoviride]